MSKGQKHGGVHKSKARPGMGDLDSLIVNQAPFGLWAFLYVLTRAWTGTLFTEWCHQLFRKRPYRTDFHVHAVGAALKQQDKDDKRRIKSLPT